MWLYLFNCYSVTSQCFVFMLRCDSDECQPAGHMNMLRLNSHKAMKGGGKVKHIFNLMTQQYSANDDIQYLPTPKLTNHSARLG